MKRHQRYLIALPLVALTLLAAIWLAVHFELDHMERTALRDATRDTETFVTEYERYTRNELQGAERTAMLVKREVERFGSLDMPALIRAHVVDPKYLETVSIIDASGNVVASSLSLSHPLNVADREYFRAHASRDLNRLEISPPLIGRASGKLLIQMTRRINRRDGTFGGVVLLSVSPELFTEYYQESLLGKQGVVGVLGLDGFYRGRRIGQEQTSAPDARNTPLLQLAMTSDAGSYESVSALDQVTRLVAFRRLPDYPLVVMAAQSKDEVLADFYRLRTIYLGVATIASALVVALFGILMALAMRLLRQGQELSNQRRFLQVLVDHLPFGVSVRSMRFQDMGQCLLWNDANRALFRIEADDVIGRTIDEVLPAGNARRVQKLDHDLLTTPVVQDYVQQHDIPDRGRRIIHTIRVPILGDHDGVDSILAISNDVTDDQQRNDQLRLASKVFETTADGIVISDADDQVISINAALTKLTGYNEDEMVGKKLADTPFRPIDVSDSDARMRVLHAEGQVTGEVPRIHRNGTALSLWVTATCVRDDAGNIVNYVRVFTDISALKRTQSKLERLANFDVLTALPNRRLLQDRLEQAIRRAERCGGGMGIVFIDLDGFKRVNDTFGHATGDLLLREVANRLQTEMRSSDSFCRMGGDEFAVVLESARAADARRVADRVLAALSAPFMVGGQKLQTGASLGIALYPDDGDNSALLLRNADAAMYRAKNRGRNRFQFFSDRTDEVANAA